MNTLDTFRLKQRLRNLRTEHSKYERQSQLSSRYTKNVDESRAKKKQLSMEILILEVKLQTLNNK